MRLLLWPEADAQDAEAWLLRGDASTLVAEIEGKLVGFAEAGIRVYADGCNSSPVAFLEGWYVDETYRKQGIGAQLVLSVEAWARANGLSELASDALLENQTAQTAHKAAGFEEVERAVRYRKPLS